MINININNKERQQKIPLPPSPVQQEENKAIKIIVVINKQLAMRERAVPPHPPLPQGYGTRQGRVPENPETAANEATPPIRAQRDGIVVCPHQNTLLIRAHNYTISFILSAIDDHIFTFSSLAPCIRAVDNSRYTISRNVRAHWRRDSV